MRTIAKLLHALFVFSTLVEAKVRPTPTPTTTITYYYPLTNTLPDGTHSLSLITVSTSGTQPVTIYKDFHRNSIWYKYPDPAFTVSAHRGGLPTTDPRALTTLHAAPTDTSVGATYTIEATLVAWESNYMYHEDSVNTGGVEEWGRSTNCSLSLGSIVCSGEEWDPFHGNTWVGTTWQPLRTWLANYTPTPTASASGNQKAIPLGLMELATVTFSGILGVFFGLW